MKMYEEAEVQYHTFLLFALLDAGTGFWWESLKERDHLKDRGIDGRMGLERILMRLAGGGCKVDSTGSG
jgi:hypothetical protein